MASDARQQTHPANPSTPRGVGVRRETAGQRDPTASNGTSLPGMTCNDSPPKASFNSAPANSHTAPPKGICRSGQISGGALHRCAKRCNDSFFLTERDFDRRAWGRSEKTPSRAPHPRALIGKVACCFGKGYGLDLVQLGITDHAGSLRGGQPGHSGHHAQRESRMQRR
jgi:hypothetical protein